MDCLFFVIVISPYIIGLLLGYLIFSLTYNGFLTGISAILIFGIGNMLVAYSQKYSCPYCGFKSNGLNFSQPPANFEDCENFCPKCKKIF